MAVAPGAPPRTGTATSLVGDELFRPALSALAAVARNVAGVTAIGVQRRRRYSCLNAFAGLILAAYSTRPPTASTATATVVASASKNGTGVSAIRTEKASR